MAWPPNFRAMASSFRTPFQDSQICPCFVFLIQNQCLTKPIYRIRRNIGGALIWRIAESSRLANFNIGGRARGHVSNTLDEIIFADLNWRSLPKPPIRQIKNPRNLCAIRYHQIKRLTCVHSMQLNQPIPCLHGSFDRNLADQ